MKKIILLLSMSFCSLLASADEIEYKIDSHKALVKFESSKLNVGDQVIVYKSTCKGPKVKLCKNGIAGYGTVSLIRPNNHYEVLFEESVKFDEGLIVSNVIP